ncbi:MAG: hypothetical protein KIT31_40365 [Deltaproteobacteria bacterium]|nr:hypothetical protein [Deltaproteobacteria bacterium]
MLRRTLACLFLFALQAEAAPPKYARPPSTSPRLAGAERLWAAAAAEVDRQKASEAWEAAAEAFLAVAEASTIPAEKREAAKASVLAWKNALHVEPRVRAARDDFSDGAEPRPIPEREQRLLRAFERYLAIDAASDDAIGILFQRANLLRRHHHFDAAMPLLLEIVNRHPRHETAEFAANLALDTFNRRQQFDQLVAFAEKLRADKAFLAGRPDLAQIVERIHAQSRLRAVEAVEKEAKETGDLALYDRCGEMYLELRRDLAPAEVDEQADALVYNAGVCFAHGRSLERSITALGSVGKRSKLRPRALGRIAMAHADLAHFAEAAAGLEEYATTFGGQDGALAAAADAVYYRTALGELDVAERDLMLALRSFARRRDDLDGVTWQLVARLLAAGKRTDARRVIAAVPDPGKDELRFEAGRLVADAACPIALVDELCPHRADAALIQRARALVTRTGHPRAARILVDLEAAGTSFGLGGLESRYRALAAADDVHTQMAAHARLGAIDAGNGRGTEAIAHFTECSRRARDAGVHPWLVTCERGLAALGVEVETVRELLPPPSAAPVPSSVEAPAPAR